MAIKRYLHVAPLAAVILACVPASALAAKAQTIKFESEPPKPALVGNTYNLKATASSGLAVSFSSATPPICTVSGATAKFEAAGSCEIDATQAGNGEWEKAEAKQVFTVKYSQTITFTSEPKSPAFGGSYTVTATGGKSGNLVTFTIDAATASDCSISGATVSFTAAGPCTIDANQAGSENYEVAPQAQQSFSVAKASQAITFTSAAPSNAVVGGPAYEVKATGGASGEPVLLTIDAASASVCKLSGNASGSLVSFQHVGTCTIDANQAGDANYEPAPQKQQAFAVGKGAQVIKFTSSPPESATVGGPPYTVTATGGGSPEPVILTIDKNSTAVCALSGKSSGSAVSFKRSGPCTIDANQEGNADYEAALTDTQEFTVYGRPQSIVFTSSPPNPAYVGQTYPVAVVGGESHEPVLLSSPTPSVCTISGSTVSLLATGVCAINANQAGNAEYAAATQVQQSFTVVSVPPPGQPPPPPTPIIQVQGVKVVGPNSSFRVVGASLSLSTYSITFVESVAEPGTFTWVLTFENGKFGDFARKAKKLKKCKAGSIKLKKKCRPARILFAKGSEAVTAAGSVTFTVRPTFTGVKALRNAFKKHKGLPVTANVTFQSARGGPAATRVQSLIVKNTR